ncbi:MAG: NAD(P)H-hydrate dehydratase [Bacteroidales bacterium]|nr:NAD(P)H-hydrate dehydratase [Bacteroidales bacterium]MCF8404341.1 NAD(P)H-hydrate dehydratase [Bacteroidales bacterium]
MKILPVAGIKEADAYTIRHEPISDLDLMERAATELFEWIMANCDPSSQFCIFCGTGNNGGDGFVVGRMLADSGVQVKLFTVRFSDKMSDSCKVNLQRAKSIKNLKIKDIYPDSPLPEIKNNEIIVDAVFGSGLTRPASGIAAKVIDHINKARSVVIAIDVPSGFVCDESNINSKGPIVQADYTLTFQFPKLGFLFAENDKFVGHWEVLNIGLHRGYINEVEVQNYFILRDIIKPIIKHRTKFTHKGTFGHGLLIAGSYGKMGACILAAKAGLKSGAGLLTAHIPRSGYSILQTATPEVMASMDTDDYVLSENPPLAPYNAIAIGPGIGTDKKTSKALKLLIQNTGLPIIFDADAINILGENKTWIPFIPKGSIFTPHLKEFERITNKAKNDFDRNKIQREFSAKYQVYVILKGAHSAITCPDGSCYFNSTGNPGMATGGSGDVLTGILLGLMAQGYSSKEASILGVYLHGLAGDMAAEKWGYEALTAGNIIHNLGKAYKKIESHPY